MLPRLQPCASCVSSTMRSVTSPSSFPQGLLTNLRRPGSQFSLHASWLYPSRLLLSQTSPVSSGRLAVCCIFLSVSCFMRSAGDIIYSRSVPKSKGCVYAITVHVCAVKRLDTAYLRLKINNFVTLT